MSEVKSKFSELVSKGIKKTVNKFREYPCLFFSETDIHSYLYYCLYSTRFEVKTKDGVVTSCLHKEYPTNFRFLKKTMKDYGLSKEGVRGHFDFAVLNPHFIQENSIKRIQNKYVEGAEAGAKNKDKFRNELLTAIELKYVVDNRKKFIEDVKKDTEKLSIGLEYQDFDAYNLVFCNTQYHYIDDLIELVENTDSSVKIMLVRSHYTNDKKNTPILITNGWSFKRVLQENKD